MDHKYQYHNGCMVNNHGKMINGCNGFIHGYLVGGLEHGWILTFPSYWEWNVMIPSDEAHHFSEGWLNHQPANIEYVIVDQE